jgi:coenzyme F420-reducing hydrogenase alpha subunit
MKKKKPAKKSHKTAKHMKPARKVQQAETEEKNGKTVSIVLDHVTKIEGHARLDIRFEGSQAKLVRLDVFEGARYFEALAKGRSFADAPTITSRICGICSQAHTLASLQAVENALKVKVSRQTEQLRNLLHLGSLIQSHALHLYFLALPDYLGFGDAISMASKYPGEVRRGLALKRVGNKICEVVAGREIHSITAVVGGFSKLPEQQMLDELRHDLLDAQQHAMRTAALFSRLKVPKFERKTIYASLLPRKTGPYTLLKGSIIAGKTNFQPERYEQFFKEQVVQTSSSKHVTMKESPLMVGALARLNNRELLSRNAKRALSSSKMKLPCSNPYMNNLCQSIELVNFVDRCIEILDEVQVSDEEMPDIRPKAGHGVSIIEAPRGLLIHDCKTNSSGEIKDYNIIAPTTINLQNIEQDILALLPALAGKPQAQIVLELEKLIRAYDPCISCSAHFLKVNWLK